MGRGDQALELTRSFAALPMILIGDSGQRDPEIYRDVVVRYPGRVAAIYIRVLAPGRRRARALAAIAAEVGRHGVPFVAVSSTDGMAADAAARGWIADADPTEPEGDADDGKR